MAFEVPRKVSQNDEKIQVPYCVSGKFEILSGSQGILFPLECGNPALELDRYSLILTLDGSKVRQSHG